jgi:hypothetical protein
MINIVVKSDTHISDLIKDIKAKCENDTWTELELELTQIGTDTEQYIREFIQSHLKRTGNTGKLAHSIESDVLQNVFCQILEIGIGNIALMDEQAPGWHLLNYGGMTVAAQTGMGVPGSFNGERPDSDKAGGSDRFGPGKFMMFPKEPIYPMNYIENADAFLNQKLTAFLSKF